MKHSLLIAPQFYVTAPQPCPYLSNRVERKLFTGLNNLNGKTLNNTLSNEGFRRSQNVLYRPACVGCSSCISARVRVHDFIPTKSQKRTLRRNSKLIRGSHTASATDEQFDLFTQYLKNRHADGGMAEMSLIEFSAMIEETPVDTRVIEYYFINKNGRHELKSASLTDVLENGLSMVYSFFDPLLAMHSPGKFMILDHINIAREMNLDYLYLGYWVPGSPKMDYKSQYSALELFLDGKWCPIDDISSVPIDKLKGFNKTILEQVSELPLPSKY
jgi:arginine-tRNA-protein transferase